MESDVSIVLPVYNGASRLEEVLRNLMGQTLLPDEIVVIDDGSTDDFLEVSRRIEDTYDRVLIHRFEENKGLPAALNHGIGLARNQIVARQDVDDLSHPRRLELQREVLRQTDAAIVTAKALYTKNPGVVLESVSTTMEAAETREITERDFQVGNPLVHGSIMVDLGRVEGFRYDESFRFSQDFELLRRLAGSGCRISEIGSPLYFYKVNLWDRKVFQQYLYSKSITGEKVSLFESVFPLNKASELFFRLSYFFRKLGDLSLNRGLKRILKVIGYMLYPRLIVVMIRTRFSPSV